MFTTHIEALVLADDLLCVLVGVEAVHEHQRHLTPVLLVQML